MDVKKRDKKARSKVSKKPDGIVDFTADPTKSKKGKRGSSGTTFPKRDGSGGANGKDFKTGKRSGAPWSGDKRKIVDKSEDAGDQNQELSNSQVRRQKKKVSDLLKKLRINYNKLLMKKRDMADATQTKVELVQDCMDTITDEKYAQLIFKHDGCRILQAMVKHGSMDQKSQIIGKIKMHFLELMQKKYSYHLAMKMYYYSPNKELKAYFHKKINGQIGKLIMHQFASEVIEFIFSQLSQSQTQDNKVARREMLAAFYGQYFIIFKSLETEQDATNDKADGDINKMSLKQFLEKKPQLQTQVLTKIESIVQKLVEKGMARHSIVQAIIADYVVSQTDIEKVKWLAETTKEKLPSFLASKQGLLVACALFNLLDAKDRKIVVKSLQEPLKEMAVNKVASLFLVHVLNTLDDTVISKKKIINDILLTLDDHVDELQHIFLGIYSPGSKRYFSSEDIAAFEVLKEHSTSKKDAQQRRAELLQAFVKPLEIFYEEKMSYYLQDIAKNPMLAKVLAARIELGDIDKSDAMDEMFRQIQKKQRIDDKLQVMLGHPDLQYVLKDLIKVEQQLHDQGKIKKTAFCSRLAKIIGSNFADVIKTRATWLAICLLEHKSTSGLLAQTLTDGGTKMINDVKKEQTKAGKVDKGVEVLAGLAAKVKR